MSDYEERRPPARTLRFPRPLTWMHDWPATSTPAQDMAARLAVTGLRLARLNLPITEAIARVLELALEEVQNPIDDERDRQRTQQALQDLVTRWTKGGI
jgi:hypothetical protein